MLYPLFSKLLNIVSKNTSVGLQIPEFAAKNACERISLASNLISGNGFIKLASKFANNGGHSNNFNEKIEGWYNSLP